LTVQEPDVQILADGSQDVTFRDVLYKGSPLTVYGRVEPLRADEFIVAEQDVSRSFVRLTIRYVPGLLPTMQLVMENGRIFEITGLMNLDARNRQIQILATEKLPPYN